MSILSEVGNSAINVILLLLILVPLVVIHEFGHFILARRAKVRVHEFGIGFPPRARVLANDGETIYTLNWLPIGGFVRLEGEEGESDDPRAFVNQRLRTRLLILAAGVAMNFLLAFVIFTFIALLADPVSNVRIGAIDPGSPAASVGLRGSNVIGTTTDANGKEVPVYDDTGDVITAIDGRVFPIFDSIDTQTPSLTYLRAHAGQTVTLTVQHADGTTENIPVTLRVPVDANQGPLGILVHPKLVSGEVHHDPLTGVAKGFTRTVDASTLILRGLGGLIANFANPPVSGPVGIVNAIGAVRTQLPPVFLLWLVGLLSANLAVINALPFPPLDGGRAAVGVIQAVSNNRIGQAAERLVYLTGFVLLMALLVWLTLFDTGILQRQTL